MLLIGNYSNPNGFASPSLQNIQSQEQKIISGEINSRYPIPKEIRRRDEFIKGAAQASGGNKLFTEPNSYYTRTLTSSGVVAPGDGAGGAGGGEGSGYSMRNNYAKAFNGNDINATIWIANSSNSIYPVGFWSSFNQEPGIDYNMDGFSDAVIIMDNTIYMLASDLDKIPQANIKWPEDGAYIKGTVTIVGTATDWNFRNYSLEWKNATVDWTLIKNSTISETDGALAEWNTTQLKDGSYLIRLRVTDNASNTNVTEVKVVIDNTLPMVNIIKPQQENIRFINNIVIGEVKDQKLAFANLTVKNETDGIVSHYHLNIINNRFRQRVEFAPGQNNTIELIALDKAGNQNISSRKVFVGNQTHRKEEKVNAGKMIKIEASNETDVEIDFVSNKNSTDNVTFTVTAIANETWINNLNSSAFNLSGEIGVGKIIDINVTGINASDETEVKDITSDETEVKDITIRMYYNVADLDLDGDEIIEPGELDEERMFIYWYNTTSGNWTKLLKNNPAWVIDNGRHKIAGNNPGNVWVQVRHLSTFALAGAMVLPPADKRDVGSSSSGGGGGGGGGGTSGENYSNIILKEKYDDAIYKDKPTSYKFKNASNPVIFINITGNVNAGLINTAVEVLKGTSTLVKEAAPGIVYRNFNLWVGTSGFSTSKNIKEATVMFRIENTWIENNAFSRSEIRLVKWENGTWKLLETSEKMRDGTYTYFEGKTTSFSPFAATGIKESAPSATPPGVTAPAATTSATTSAPPESAQPLNLALIIGVVVLIAVIVAVYMKRK